MAEFALVVTPGVVNDTLASMVMQLLSEYVSKV